MGRGQAQRAIRSTRYRVVGDIFGPAILSETADSIGVAIVPGLTIALGLSVRITSFKSMLSVVGIKWVRRQLIQSIGLSASMPTSGSADSPGCVSVDSPLPFPGSAAILAAILAGGTPAFPRGVERLRFVQFHMHMKVLPPSWLIQVPPAAMQAASLVILDKSMPPSLPPCNK
jgi:hypothetical protein